MPPIMKAVAILFISSLSFPQTAHADDKATSTVFTSPNFISLRIAYALPDETDLAFEVLSQFADLTFNETSTSFVEPKLSQTFRDLSFLAPSQGEIEGQNSAIPDEEYDRALRLIVSSRSDGTRQLTKKYSEFRKARPEFKRKNREFGAHFTESLSDGVATTPDLQGAQGLGWILSSLLEYDLKLQAANLTRAREIVDHFDSQSQNSDWIERQRRMNLLTDAAISPSSFFVPDPKTLLSNDSSWQKTTILMPLAADSTLTSTGLTGDSLVQLQFEYSVVYITRPWLDVVHLHNVKAAYSSQIEAQNGSQVYSINPRLSSLMAIPERVPVAFVLARNVSVLPHSSLFQSDSIYYDMPPESEFSRFLRDLAYLNGRKAPIVAGVVISAM